MTVPDEIVEYLAGLSADEWADLASRARPPEEHPDPKVRAVAALRNLRAGETSTSAPTDGEQPPAGGKKAAAAAAVRQVRSQR